MRVGEPLISFDLDALQADNIDPSIIIIVTNTERYNDISLISQTKVEPREAFETDSSSCVRGTSDIF